LPTIEPEQIIRDFHRARLLAALEVAIRHLHESNEAERIKAPASDAVAKAAAERPALPPVSS